MDVRMPHVALLVRFYITFVVRRVLSRGILSSPAARLGVGAIVVATLGLLTAISYAFLSRTAGDTEVLSLLLNLSSLSAVLWVFVAFIFTKVLFLKSERMLSLTFHLPVTGRERAVALLVWEALMVLSVVAVLFTSSVVPMVLLHGASAIVPIVWALVFPVVTAYVALNAAYMAALRVLGLIGLERSRTVILLVVVSAAAALYYGRVTEATVAIANSYGQGRATWSLPLAYTYLAQEFGWHVSIGAFLVSLIALVWASIALAPHTYVPSQRHVPFPLGFVARIPRVGPQLAMHVRSTEWVLAAFLALVLGTVCVVTGLAPAPAACGLLVLNGLGAYAATSRCRWIHPPAAKTGGLGAYVALVGAQALAATPIVVLLTGAACVAGADVSSQLIAAAGVYVGIVVVTAVGVLFPPEQDNPFSMAVGVSVVVAIAVLAVLATSALALDGPALVGSGVLALLIIVLVSIAGMSINDQRSRYEESNQRGNGRVDSADHHARGDGRGRAFRHVQHIW